MPALDGYDTVGVSSLPYDTELVAELRRLRDAFSGRIVLGGKCTSILFPQDRKELADIGIDVIDGAGEVLFSGEIDYATYPAWPAADFRKLIRPDCKYPMTEMMTSRGCPYRCTFCHNTEPKVRRFAAERCVQNAAMILGDVGQPRVFIVDDVFTLNADHMASILALSDSCGLDLRKRNSFFVHVDQLKTEQLELVAAYQPQEVQVGIESGSDEMIKAMGKTYTAAKAEDRLKALHASGIATAGLFLIGFPGETRQSLQDTVDFVERNRKYMHGWWVSYYQPVPFTKGWELARDRLGHHVDGQWNVDVSYVDPNIAEQDLLDARQAIMTY